MISVESPYTHAELVQAWSDVERRVADFFGSLSDEEFVLRAGTAWTPAEQLEHLNIAVRQVARGFAAPRWLLALLFGRANAPSRTYEMIRETYRERLSRGAQAPVAYIPRGEAGGSGSVSERKARTLERWAHVNANAKAALTRWSEAELDRIRFPHPILKKLTAREMAFFTLYHNEHHVAAAKRRLPRFDASQAS